MKSKAFFFILTLFLGPICFPCSGSSAGTIVVPDHYGNIQDAIDAAVNGDVISVKDNVYTGTKNKNLDFKGKEITVQSQNGPVNCIIDCQDAGRGFHFHSSETSNSVLSGFTIRNGLLNGYGGAGIYCNGSSPTITNCVIESCHVNAATGTPGYGGGIAFYNSNSTFSNCTIRQNYAESGGGGAYFRHCSATLSDCFIINNTTIDIGGGIRTYASTVDIQSSIIKGNQATNRGGGIYIYEDNNNVPPKIINTIIAKNGANLGGGIYNSATNPVITNCTLVYSTDGQAIYADSATPIVTNCIVWGNQSGAFKEVYGGSINATYCDIDGGWPGTGNINLDPLFENSAADDYHVKTNSPTINTGTDTAPSLPTDDLDGNPRPYLIWLVPPVGWIDMGVYELQGLNTPFVTTTTPTAITANSASSGGSILCTGCAPVIRKGVCWDTSQNPTIADSFTLDGGLGTGTYTSTITGLTENTAYHVRAYATTTADTYYGENKTFTTISYADSCPDCTGDVVVFRDRTFPNNSKCSCYAAQLIEIGPNVLFESGSVFEAISNKVTIQENVEIKTGADFNVHQ
jgi:hypothetical protein